MRLVTFDVLVPPSEAPLVAAEPVAAEPVPAKPPDATPLVAPVDVGEPVDAELPEVSVLTLPVLALAEEPLEPELVAELPDTAVPPELPLVPLEGGVA